MMRMTEAVKQLIIINIIFFVGTLVVGQAAYDWLALYMPANPHFKFWQPLTHMFMHGGIMHIFFNMFALFSFGTLLESMWGSKKFVFFYISCGLGAALLQIAVNYYSFHHGIELLASAGVPKEEVLSLLAQGQYDTRWRTMIDPTALDGLIQSYSAPTVGASGAIYGILVAFAFIAPNAELMLMFVPVPIKAKYFVPGLVLIDLFLGIKGQSIFGSGGSNVAHFAHIGGALIGLLMVWYWKKHQFNNNRWN